MRAGRAGVVRQIALVETLRDPAMCQQHRLGLPVRCQKIGIVQINGCGEDGGCRYAITQFLSQNGSLPTNVANR